MAWTLEHHYGVVFVQQPNNLELNSPITRPAQAVEYIHGRNPGNGTQAVIELRDSCHMRVSVRLIDSGRLLRENTLVSYCKGMDAKDVIETLSASIDAVFLNKPGMCKHASDSGFIKEVLDSNTDLTTISHQLDAVGKGRHVELTIEYHFLKNVKINLTDELE